MNAASAAGSWLGLGVVFVLGAAGGYAMGRTGTEVRGPSEVVPTDVAALRQDILELGRVLASAMESDVSAPATPALASREPVGRAGDALDLAALRALVERCEHAAERVAVAGSPGALFIPEQRSQPLPPKPEDDDAKELLSRRFQFWTHQQILDAFGRPDEADDHAWTYWRGQDHRADGGFIVRFSQGYVVSVEAWGPRR